MALLALLQVELDRRTASDEGAPQELKNVMTNASVGYYATRPDGELAADLASLGLTDIAADAKSGEFRDEQEEVREAFLSAQKDGPVVLEEPTASEPDDDDDDDDDLDDVPPPAGEPVAGGGTPPPAQG